MSGTSMIRSSCNHQFEYQCLDQLDMAPVNVDQDLQLLF